MDKIKKFLRKLSAKDRKLIARTIAQLHTKEAKSLDVKKLKGEKNIFRVRVGKIRIIYSLLDEEIVLHRIDFRNENTYS